MPTWVRPMTASSQPKLWVMHILVINLKQTRMVAGPKTAQLTAMSNGPRFLSPEEGIISALSIAVAAAQTGERRLQPVKEATVPSSLGNDVLIEQNDVEDTQNMCRRGC